MDRRNLVSLGYFVVAGGLLAVSAFSYMKFEGLETIGVGDVYEGWKAAGYLSGGFGAAALGAGIWLGLNRNNYKD